MSKDKEHLLDDLIEALEAMSQDAHSMPPSGPAVPPLADAPKHVAASSPMKAVPFHHLGPDSSVGRLAAKGYRRIASLSDVRMVIRMSALLVIAGALTLFFITRPYTSRSADAHMPTDPSKLIAKAHTELERVTLRVADEPRWARKTELPPVEPVSIGIEPRPAVTAFDTRPVQTQVIRPEQKDAPEAGAASAFLPIPPVAAGERNAPEPEKNADSTATLPTTTREGTSTPGTPAPAVAPVDPETAARMEALYRRGLELEKLNDITGARLLFKRAADRGHAEAMFALGQTYDAAIHPQAQALGVVMNEELARWHYIRARDLGSKRAKDRLAILYGLKG
ncbi:hypothetical protein GCM10007276_26340 [Agaricicola taiwanensis]|uniref:Sel1 repeat family protein n=1 Tax=Agaricicola taiwanensis TaxID=591372 RepID=A0A8J2YJN0_9RHOB|nr:hypothetical protein [Agaricicola taiwanensis]GGE47825.1 hypothetical protein GCM10007276_26340 [Agaricicola taiwanensis]